MSNRPRVRPLLVAAAVSALIATAAPKAFSQTAEGSIYGRVAAGSTVTVTSEAIGITRTTAAQSDGSFNISRLPAGTYTVSADGRTTNVVVRIGTGSAADFNSLEEVTVAGMRQRTIDFTSTESNAVFTQEMVQQLPVPLNVNAVATLTPTVLRGDTGLGSGDLPSFAGSSVAENAYYINGFDVTNIRNFLSYADLPYEAVAQQQVKAGGYGAEYGRSLGGVISLATKRGTNEWSGGVSVGMNPSGLQSSGQNVLSREPSEPGVYSLFQQPDNYNEFAIGAFVGGPIIQDRLFAFAMVQMNDTTDRNFGQTLATRESSSTPSGMLKLDWNIADGHLLEATGIYNKKRTEYVDFTNATPFSTSFDGNGGKSWTHTGGHVGILKYTGQLTDRLTFSALYGEVSDLTGVPVQGARQEGLDCPVVLETNLAEIGCWPKPFPSVGVRLPGAPDVDERTAWRADVEYQLGSHKLRAGYDAQSFESTEIGGSTFTGGIYYRYFPVGASGVVNGVGGFQPGTQVVRGRIVDSTSGTFAVDNNAF
ncbi:MAG: hypothetical protein RL030_691, partial [Pseudomonadota bacterium]